MQLDERDAGGGGGTSGMVTLHQMAEASFGQAGASATSVVYLGARVHREQAVSWLCFG